MQVGQHSASIAAYNSQAGVNLNNTAQHSAAPLATPAASDNTGDATSATAQPSYIVSISPQAQGLAAGEVVANVGNGTGKPPLDPP